MSRLFNDAVQYAPDNYKLVLISVFDTADMVVRWLEDNKLPKDLHFIAKMTEEVLKRVENFPENNDGDK